MINCDKVVKFQKKDAELIDMLKILQKDVRSLENAYMSRLGKVGEAWRFLIRRSDLLTEEEWDKANKLYSTLMDLSYCVHNLRKSITDEKVEYYMNELLECKDESEDSDCIHNANRLMEMNKKKAMEFIGCNPLTCKSRYVNCAVVEFDGKCMCTELRNLIKMAEWKDKAYRNDRENIRKHYMRFLKEFENKVEEWFLRNFCIHPHDGSVITGNFDQKFGSMDEFMDFAKKDMENNDYE